MNDEMLERVCAHLNEDPENVTSYRVYGDRVVLVVDHGIHGPRKYSVPLEDLPELPPEYPPDLDATEAAWLLAAEHGVDLRTISGSGKDGRILTRNVRDALGGVECTDL